MYIWHWIFEWFFPRCKKNFNCIYIYIFFIINIITRCQFQEKLIRFIACFFKWHFIKLPKYCSMIWSSFLLEYSHDCYVYYLMFSHKHAKNNIHCPLVFIITCNVLQYVWEYLFSSCSVMYSIFPENHIYTTLIFSCNRSFIVRLNSTEQVLCC